MVLFFIVAVAVAVLLALIPTFITVDPKTWGFIRVMAIIGLFIWACVIFVPLIKGLV